MIMKYYWEGRDAYRNKRSYEESPYVEGTLAYQSWRMGWMRSQCLALDGGF